MSVQRLRQSLSYLIVIVVTLCVAFILRHLQDQTNYRQVATEISEVCELPDIPQALTIHHASIDHSESEQYVNIILSLGGPTHTLDAWLEKVDQWENKRPGVIQNHRIRESEMSSRADFTAEVFLK